MNAERLAQISLRLADPEGVPISDDDAYVLLAEIDALTRERDEALQAIRRTHSAEAGAPHLCVGMPATLWLDQFGSYVWDAFGEIPYLVGSALKGDKSAGARDVDVRLILDDEDWDRHRFGNPDQTHHNAKWVALCLAFSELGKRLTGLPIDFQIQQRTHANKSNDGKLRSALGLVPLRSAARMNHKDDCICARCVPDRAGG